MSSPIDRPLNIELKLSSSHPQLLTGLDIWLRMGLISDTQVKQVCREFLVCQVVLQSQVAVVTPQPVITNPSEPTPVPSILQSLGSELSVRWLLFLGVFLVILSSGVLAASQWERFPAAAQYGVLLAYTLSFWGFSFWAARQSRLRLTAQTLWVVTLLLVPINFWTMDGLRLWQHPFNWVVMAMASLVLTVSLWRNPSVIANLPMGRLPLINILALSYLHWGWKVPGFPLIALYLAMIGTAVVIVSLTEEQEPDFSTIVVIYALLVLLVRAVFVVGVDFPKLGLAIGISGWLLARGGRIYPLFLLLLGWVVSVSGQPGQAIMVSGLALSCFHRRLHKYSFPGDLVAFFLIGLQGIWLGWRLIPEGLQDQAIAFATHLIHGEKVPWALLGVVLFPYIIFMVAVTDRLHRVNKGELAKLGEQLTCGLGVALTLVASVNPRLCSLNLLLSTITLAIVTQRRAHPEPILVYLTHTAGVLTLCAVINTAFPTLRQEYWAGILLVLMLGEWGFSLGRGLWQRSGWYMGLGLATVSFVILWLSEESYTYGVTHLRDYWGIMWLAAPIALAGLNGVLSVLAVAFAQLLTLSLPGVRLMGLGVGVIVMLVNTRRLRNKLAAEITVGFGVCFLGALMWEWPPLSLAGWFVAGAMMILGLWLGETILRLRRQDLGLIYAPAFDKWAIALSGVGLVAMTLHQELMGGGWLYCLSTGILLVAIIYRSWQQPTNWAFYGIGWCLELLVAEIPGAHSRIEVAIANIALGLGTQLFGEWWQRQHQLDRLPSSFHVLPLIYAALSICLRLDTFTNWTGCCTLGVAVIMIGVGRRSTRFKPLLYLGIFGVSVAAYELLLYHISPVTGLIAMSALGTTLMYAYHLLSPKLVTYLHLTPQELQVIAHLHWLWSSCLYIIASYQLPSYSYVSTGTGLFLARYALWQGRREEIWVYLGLWEGWLLIRGLAMYLLPWQSAVACGVGYFLYILPWEQWGWSQTPWRRVAYVLPLINLWYTRVWVSPFTLLLVAGYYVFLSWGTGKFRLTYLSMLLVDWALFRWVGEFHLPDSLWYVVPIGLSVLFIAQVDELLRQRENRDIRHWVRIGGTLLICGWATLFHQDNVLIPGFFSLIAVFAGLGLRVRAFLYVGTASFMMTSFYQLVLFSLQFPFLKWVVGLLVGVLLIYVAANFETRRTQINSLLRSTGDQFQHWE